MADATVRTEEELGLCPHDVNAVFRVTPTVELLVFTVAVTQPIVFGAVGRRLRNCFDSRVAQCSVVVEPIRRKRYLLFVPASAHHVTCGLVVLNAELTHLTL